MLLKSLPNVKPLLTGQLILKILSKKIKFIQKQNQPRKERKKKGKIAAAAIDYVSYLANN